MTEVSRRSVSLSERRGGSPALKAAPQLRAVRSIQSLVEEITEKTTRWTGADFLQALVRATREALNAHLVMITLRSEEAAGQTNFVDSSSGMSMLPALEGTLSAVPCVQRYSGDSFVISDTSCLSCTDERSCKDCLSVILQDEEGREVGQFMALSKDAFDRPEDILTVMRLFAKLAEAELRRMQLERKRGELMLFLAKMNRGLSDRQKELHAAGEIKTLLLGTVAHDLRNPLSVILNRSELIQNLLEMPQADAARIKASCEAIEQAVEGMQRLISATLAQAASEAARIKIDSREFDVHHAIEMAIALNQATADAKSISIEIKMDEKISIRGDEDRIVEALDNLIGNAIKYSYRDSRITIGARKTSDMVELFVKDRGQGLTPEDRSRAFRNFSKLSAKPTAGEASTGLGLAIVKAIALAHGGDVSIVSAGRNRGAKFIISLPL